MPVGHHDPPRGRTEFMSQAPLATTLGNGESAIGARLWVEARNGCPDPSTSRWRPLTSADVHRNIQFASSRRAFSLFGTQRTIDQFKDQADSAPSGKRFQIPSFISLGSS